MSLVTGHAPSPADSATLDEVPREVVDSAAAPAAAGVAAGLAADPAADAAVGLDADAAAGLAADAAAALAADVAASLAADLAAGGAADAAAALAADAAADAAAGLDADAAAGLAAGAAAGLAAGAAAGLATGATADMPGAPALDRLAFDATKLPAHVRWRRALTALAKVMVNPEQTDQVLVFSIYANAGSMPSRIERFFASEAGRRLYDEHRMINSRTIDLDALLALSSDTLGHAYATFLRSRGLTPAVFDAPPSEVNDPRISYVVQRLRQTHDLWHVVTGHDTDPASEVALQAFTFAQVRAPSSAILATLGTLRALRQRPGVARSVVASLRLGLRAAPLPVFPWEDHWTTPLHHVRSLLGIPVEGVKTRPCGCEIAADRRASH